MTDTGLQVARSRVPAARAWGIGLAVGAATISGVAVYLNGRGLQRWSSPTTYTTAKNLVAALLLLGVTAALTARGSADGWTAPTRRFDRWGLVAIGVVGGSVPFVLFFEGLARTGPTDAAFLQKTLVVWVAVLAVPLLGERLRPVHVAAIAALLVGQALLQGGAEPAGARTGVLMILAATLLWSGEVVLAKRVLRQVSPLSVAVARMALGSVVLLGWLAVKGDLADLADAGASAWGWALLTGIILAAYVSTWLFALARAQAIDVTAVLVLGAVITAVLSAGIDDATVSVLGALLVLLGVVVMARWPTRQAVAAG
jgi:drug/metabolite transporter (DMT)-like permease